jgi:hypothetical protein
MRDFDFVMFEHDVLVGLGYAIQDLLSEMPVGPVVAGFPVSGTSPASLLINVGAGRIYASAYPDPTAVGSIPQDMNALCVMQGQFSQQQLQLTPPAVGLSQWNLIQVQFSANDVVRTGDPNGGVVPFYNSTNPTIPNSASIATVRQHSATVQIIQGAAATTGSEVPPQPTFGWTPLYLVDLAGGQSQVTSNQLIPAGPSVGTNVPSSYPAAPFLAGMLASHHLGKPGHAPKIDLAREVQGILSSANLPPNVLTGTFPTVRTLATSNIIIYVSSQAGSDTTGTGSAAAPFQTIQHAMDFAAATYDMGGGSLYTLQIKLANGTYANFTARSIVGAASFSLAGNLSTPASVVIQGTNNPAMFVPTGVSVTITGITFQASGSPTSYNGAGHGIVCNGTVAQTGPVAFGTCGGSQILVQAGGGGYTSNGYAIALTGGAQSAFQVFGGALCTLVNTNVSISNSPNYSAAFAIANACGILAAYSMTFGGTATGQTYSAAQNGVILTNGAGANYFPGTIAGNYASGGQYV